MLSDDELRDAMRGLANRVSADPATWTAVQRNGRRIRRRRHGYAATGVAAVLVAAPFAVNAATAGSDGGPQVVTPLHRPSPAAHRCVTPTPSPSSGRGRATPTPTPSGGPGRSTPTATPGDGTAVPTPTSRPSRCGAPTSSPHPTPSPSF